MTRAATFACFVVLASACSDGPTAPAPTGPVTFRAVISAANELPAIAGAEAGGTGTATITLNPTRDADGIITGGTIDTTIVLSGLPAGTVITAAHVHVGGAAATGAIVQETGLAARGGATLDSGSGTISLQGTPVTGLVANALVANVAGYYFNVHSALNAGGAARGQLALQ